MYWVIFTCKYIHVNYTLNRTYSYLARPVTSIMQNACVSPKMLLDSHCYTAVLYEPLSKVYISLLCPTIESIVQKLPYYPQWLSLGSILQNYTWNFWKVKGQGDRYVMYIVYDTFGIKGSQARVDNSWIKHILGFICAFNICISLSDSFGQYISRFSLKMWLTGQFFILSKNCAQCIIHDTSNFFHFDGWKKKHILS